jgi:hypothetical protein
MVTSSTSSTAATAPVSSTMRLRRIVARVFPAGTRLVEAGGDDDAAGYFVVSDEGGPRWLLPADPAATGEVLDGWAPFGLRTRLQWWLLRRAYHLGWLPPLAGRIERIALALPNGPGFAHLGWQAKRPPVVLVQIGRPDPAQKALVTLIDPDEARPCAVAKLALGDAAAVAIAREATTLVQLARERPGLAPALLEHDPSAGRILLAYLHGRPSGRRLTAAHLDWLEGLRIQGATARLGPGTAPDSAGTLPPPVAEACRRLADTAPLPAFWMHGDFAPWNIKLGADGRLLVVDWEEARAGMPPLQDLLYFHYNQSVLLHRGGGLGRLRRETASLRACLSRLGVAPERLGEIVLHFLASQWLLRRERGEADYAAFLAADLQLQLAGQGL